MYLLSQNGDFLFIPSYCSREVLQPDFGSCKMAWVYLPLKQRHPRRNRMPPGWFISLCFFLKEITGSESVLLLFFVGDFWWNVVFFSGGIQWNIVFFCAKEWICHLCGFFFNPVKMNGDVSSKLRLNKPNDPIQKKSCCVSLQTHRHPIRGDIFTHFDGP